MSKDYTTSDDHPNLPEEGPRDIRVCYIEHTRGLWVRKNREADELEIWMDGQLHTAWKTADMIEERFTTMLREAFDMGVQEGRRRCRVALSDAFGLKVPS